MQKIDKIYDQTLSRLKENTTFVLSLIKIIDMKQLGFLTIIIFTISCSVTKSLNKNFKQTLLDNDTFVVTEISTDKSYGLSEKNPVEVGGANESSGPKNERRYLNALTGPNREQVSYFRSGSCCPVKSSNGFLGTAMLDNYRVTWEGSKDTVSIYINIYDSSKIKAPFGFGVVKNSTSL